MHIGKKVSIDTPYLKFIASTLLPADSSSCIQYLLTTLNTLPPFSVFVSQAFPTSKYDASGPSSTPLPSIKLIAVEYPTFVILQFITSNRWPVLTPLAKCPYNVPYCEKPLRVSSVVVVIKSQFSILNV